MMDHWKEIPGMAGFEVSTLGCVRKNGTPVKVSLRPSRKGYPTFCGKKEGLASQTHYVHRAMALAFYGPPPFTGAAHAAHYDGTRNGNYIENIRWATPTENAEDTARHGRHMNGEKSPKAIVTEDQAREIVRRYKTDGVVALAREFGFKVGTVGAIGRRENWKHLSG